jgi:hypothetical protein
MIVTSMFNVPNFFDIEGKECKDVYSTKKYLAEVLFFKVSAWLPIRKIVYVCKTHCKSLKGLGLT